MQGYGGKCVLGKTNSTKVLRWESLGLFEEQRANQCVIMTSGPRKAVEVREAARSCGTL